MKRRAAAKPKPAPSPFEFSGGALCLDFVNTVSWRRAENKRERLPDPAALAAWSREAGLLDAARAQHALQRAARQPRQAQAELRRAKDLREAIFTVCSAAAAKRAAKPEQVGALNRAMKHALAHSELRARGASFAWAYRGPDEPMAGVLWAVARSAAELLTSPVLLEQLRECGAENCAWLFLDHSKNGSRRWCDMRVCGNRAKVRRFRRRVLVVGSVNPRRSSRV